MSDRASPEVAGRLAIAGRGTVAMTVGTLAASFVAQVWMGRQLGPPGLGAYHATSLFVILLVTVGSAGLPIAVAERVARLDEERSPEMARLLGAALLLAVALALVIASIGWLAWSPFAALAGLRGAAPDLLVAAALAGMMLQSVTTSVLLGRLRVAAATGLVLVQPVSVIIGAAANAFGAGLGGSTLAALGPLASGVAAAPILAGLGPIRSPHGDIVRELVRRSLAASSVLYPSFVAGWLERFFIVTLVSASALGAFAAASALTEGVLRLARNVGTLSVPAYARLAGEVGLATRLLESQVRVMAGFFIVTGTAMVAAGPGFIAFLFGPGFAIAGTTLRLLAIALLPVGLVLSLAGKTAGTDQLRRAARIMLLVAPLHIAGTILGIRAFSIAGVALSDLLVWSLCALLFAAPWSSRGLVRPWVVALVAGVAVPAYVFAWWLSLQPIPWLVSGALAATAAAILCAAFILTAAEGRILRSLATRPPVLSRIR